MITAFIGLGMMGLPMATRLARAGFAVRGADLSPAAREQFAANGGSAFASAREAAAGVSMVITMLPDGAVVRAVLSEIDLAPGSLVIDMSSSAPLATRELADKLTTRAVHLIDAPVSGGVKRAVDGSLAIMVGGDPAQLERARPLFEAMGKSIIHVGPIGSGHAAKALNNYVSAMGLQAACEAAIIAEKFGIDPATLIDVFNVSTGRNNSTELKMKPHILSGAFASGFSLALMAKDLATAADLAANLEIPAPGAQASAKLWAEALAKFGKNADHTEIYRYLIER